MIQLTNEQQIALEEILHFTDTYNPDIKDKFVLTGYAGTGKTTIISELIRVNDEFEKLKQDEEDKRKIAIITLTWKASLVLKKQGLDQACTIHSFLYNAEFNTKTGLYQFYRKDIKELQRKYRLVIIDEASMISKEIRNDLISLKIPLIFVGDPFQLPAISNTDESLLANPDVKLTNILRQALDNPIIELSIQIRENPNFKYPIGNYKNLDKIFVVPKNRLKLDWMNAADQILCGLNKTRLEQINFLRKANNIDPTKMPQKGEKLIALTNHREKLVFNGTNLFPLKDYSTFDLLLDKKKIHVENEIDGKSQYVTAVFSDYSNKPAVKDTKFYSKDPIIGITFGSVITVHKAQGSAWNKVLIFNEPFGTNYEDKRKWMYVALTRTIEKCIILV